MQFYRFRQVCSPTSWSWSCSSCLSSWKWDSSLSLGEEVARDKGWSLSIVAPTNKTAPTSNDYYFLRETQIKMIVVFMMPKYFTFFSVGCFDIWCFPVWDVLMLLLPGRLSRAELINQRTTAQLSCQIGNNNGKRKRGIAKIQFSSLHFARIEMTRPDQTRSDQIRPDQTRPDQTRPDQTRPDQTPV